MSATAHVQILDEPAPTPWGPAHATSYSGTPLVWLCCPRCGKGAAYLHLNQARPRCYTCGRAEGPDSNGPELVTHPDQPALWAAYFVGGAPAVAAMGKDRVVSAGADLQDAVPEEP